MNNHIESMRLFHACGNKVRGWIDWYLSTEGSAGRAGNTAEAGQ